MKKNTNFSRDKMSLETVPRKTISVQTLSDFIFNAIQNRREKYITLNELLDEGNAAFTSQLGISTSWHIIKAKQDLENQGKLKISFSNNRSQIIRIRTRKFSAKEYLFFQ